MSTPTSQLAHEVSPDDAEARVMAAISRPGLLEELYEFGGLMVDEVLSRTEQLDSKATTLLGWTVAVVAFLVFGIHDQGQSISVSVKVLVAIAAGCALLASIQAGLALRVIDWEIPSEADWFKFELFTEPDKLRVYHLLGMLEMHQRHNRQNMLKAQRVRRSQWLLIGATMLLGVIVVVKW